MFVRLLLELAGVVQFDQIDGFLDIMEFFLVTHSERLVAPAELVDSLDLVGIVFKFLDEGRSTHWLILLTSIFFWMVYLVRLLFFLILSFYF